MLTAAPTSARALIPETNSPWILSTRQDSVWVNAPSSGISRVGLGQLRAFQELLVGRLPGFRSARADPFGPPERIEPILPGPVGIAADQVRTRPPIHPRDRVMRPLVPVAMLHGDHHDSSKKIRPAPGSLDSSAAGSLTRRAVPSSGPSPGNRTIIICYSRGAARPSHALSAGFVAKDSPASRHRCKMSPPPAIGRRRVPATGADARLHDWSDTPPPGSGPRRTGEFPVPQGLPPRTDGGHPHLADEAGGPVHARIPGPAAPASPSWNSASAPSWPPRSPSPRPSASGSTPRSSSPISC